MRGSKAKKLRKMIYGDISPRVRKYGKTKNGSIVADARRRGYQMAKTVPLAVVPEIAKMVDKAGV